MGEFQRCKDKSASCYPTQWAWNAEEELGKAFRERLSPSHAVGLEPMRKVELELYRD